MGAAAVGIGLSAITVGNTTTQRNAILAKGTVDEAVARSDARVARIQKANAIRAGEKNVQRLRSRQSILSGAQTANLADQGIDPRSGSGTAVILESRLFGDLDVIEARRNARLEAFGFEAKALSSEGKARFARLNAKAAARQTLLTGTNQILRDALFFGSNSANQNQKFKPRNQTEGRFNRGFQSSGDTASVGFAR